MPRDLKVSRPLIFNMILFININKISKWKIIYIMTYSVVHWNTWDDSFAISMQGEILLSSLMASVMCLHFSVQEEDIREDTNVKCH